MSPTLRAFRVGAARGRAELRHTFSNAQDLFGYIFPTVLLLAVMIFMRGGTVPGPPRPGPRDFGPPSPVRVRSAAKKPRYPPDKAAGARAYLTITVTRVRRQLMS